MKKFLTILFLLISSPCLAHETYLRFMIVEPTIPVNRDRISKETFHQIRLMAGYNSKSSVIVISKADPVSEESVRWIRYFTKQKGYKPNLYKVQNICGEYFYFAQ